MNNLFGWSNGSSDESDIKITGFELFRLFKYMKSKFFFILLIFLKKSAFNIYSNKYNYSRQAGNNSC